LTASKVDQLEEYLGKVRIQPLPYAREISTYGSSLRRNGFDHLLLESVDETLANLLGRGSRDQIYDHLATRYRYGREDIPAKIVEFYEFLEHVFGSAARTIGRAIIRRLSDKLGYEFVNVPGFDFVDHLDSLRARIERDADSEEQPDREAPVRPY
jgi:hypothetical protein